MNQVSRQPPGRGWRQRLRAVARVLWSLLLGAMAIFGAVLIFRQGLLPLIDTAFHPTAQALSAIRRVGILLVAVLAYWAYVRWHEKRAPTELRPKPLPVVLGGMGGAALVGLPIAALFALGAYEAVALRGFSSALMGVAGVIVIAATLEELVYRCLLLRVMERSCGTTWALAIQAVVFAMEHLGNVEQGDVGDAATMLVSVTLLGLLWGGLFVLTRNLWVVAAHHAAWNFTILLSGVPLSGIEDWRSLAPIESRLAGPRWLTGGMFGPESSLLVIALVAVAVVLLLRSARRRVAFVGS
ncbi:MAG TPA: type II CAAX endopeptidase family protein [Stenotrophomonas sp.]|jgi:membrane protease YdiL (CAAX protease family)